MHYENNHRKPKKVQNFEDQHDITLCADRQLVDKTRVKSYHEPVRAVSRLRAMSRPTPLEYPQQPHR